VVGIVGTTIASWQLFFQQSCIADKRLRFADLKWARLDTLIGSAFTIIVAGCMMMTGNAALRHGLSFTDPTQMAADLSKVFGPWFRTGKLLLMINAAALGTTAISLSSAWAYGEVKGWPDSLQTSIKEPRLLWRSCPVYGRGCRFGPDPEGSAAAHHLKCPSAGGHHAGLRNHFSAAVIE
jgi:Mn2+/Fe2+ NRAMP family transporter